VGTEKLPLTGLRVIEFCWVWSGPMVGQHLADLGAEVVKVEWYKRYDLYRTRGVERLRGKIPEQIRRESSYSFQSLNRNKIGFAADLKREEGTDVVKDLIRESDILLENFTVGTLDRLGLDSAELDRLNKKLVVISLSATGRGSSIESLRSYGLMLSALGGYESEITDERGDFIGSPTFVMSDPNAALFGVYAALAGALHARETGQGATYECSQVEAVATLMNAPAATPPAAQDGMFQVSDGHYVAVTLPDGEDGAAFAQWALQQDMDTVLRTVREKGGVATRVDSLANTEASDVFNGTDVRQAVDHPVSGLRDIVATPWLVNGKRPAIRMPAPSLGGDTDDVLSRVLNYSEQQIAALHASGVIDEADA
jgi:crotonobetainyl-CoA:carnitine CoA-transferase CaiB-like acyl-CoA transferase